MSAKSSQWFQSLPPKQSDWLGNHKGKGERNIQNVPYINKALHDGKEYYGESHFPIRIIKFEVSKIE